jgi:hypothetical protein
MSTSSSFSRGAREFVARRGSDACVRRILEESTGDRRRILLELLERAGGHDLATAHARAGPEIDDVIGAPNGVLVVLDDHERVAVLRQLASASSSTLLSRGCRPMVGSSST